MFGSHRRHRGDHHHDHDSHGFGRRFAGRFGFGEGRGGRQGRHGRGGGGRFFDHGELRLVVLDLIAQKPSHGYELIKAIEEKLAGSYSPSPGVIYPTLTLLEELGQVTVTPEEGGKKLYTLTPDGERALVEAAPDIERIKARMAEVGAESPAGSALQVMRAMHNLRMALRLRVARGNLNDAQLAKIVDIVDKAARDVEQA